MRTPTLATGKYSADEESGGKGAWQEEEKEEKGEEEEEEEGGGASGFSYWYKRTVYISDTYLSQAIYQSYALFVMAIILTIGGGMSYAAVDPTTTYLDGCWAAFTWIAAGVLGGEALNQRMKNEKIVATFCHCVYKCTMKISPPSTYCALQNSVQYC